MSVLAAIGILALLIVVHELGHFLAARLQGIYADRFSIGFGPVLLRYQGSQTEYALRALPLGGYVGFPDDDPDSDIDPRDPNLLRNRPILDRAIVISAGVLANLLFAFLILVTQVGVLGVPDGIDPRPGILVPQVMGTSSVAARAGLQAGDVILAVNGEPLPSSAPSVKELVQRIKTSPEQPLRFEVQRGAQSFEITVVPERSGEEGRIGVQLAPNGQFTYRRPTGFGEVFRLASNQFEQILRQTLQGFGQLVTRFGETAGQVSGPVKIVEWGANLAASDSGSLFLFAALISVNLAVINILPLPALDGGQLLLLVFEALRGGRPLPMKVQEGFMQTGLVLLLGLGAFLIVRDTTQLAWVQQLLLQ